MTTIFREIPSKYWLLIFHTDSYLSKTVRESATEASEELCMPTSLSNLLEILVSSHDAQYIGRQHKESDSDHGDLKRVCQDFPLNHYHVLLYIPNHTNTQDVLKQTVTQVLSTTQNAYAKLLTISYPENFVKSETAVSTKNSFFIRGEKIQSLMNQKTTEDLGCKFNCIWEFQKHNSMGACSDNEKALYVFERLLELEKSEAPFKDTILSYIDLLQRGAGRLFLSEHSRTLDIDLGWTNAQCMCFDCMNHQPLHGIGVESDRNPNFSNQLFSVYDEDTITDTSFL